jgi:threonylcarbamoyladenosine tRNA methylthiotransferase MtaB
MKTRNERSKMLHILSDKKRRFFYEQQLQKKFAVLWEAENDQDIMYGFTSNYVKVQTNYDPSLVNEIMEVQLEQITDNMLVKVKQLSLV